MRPPNPSTGLPANNRPQAGHTAPRRFFRLRLSIIIVFAVLSSILLAQTTQIVPLFYLHEKHLLEDLRDETTRLVKIATLHGSLEDQTEKDIIDILDRLSVFSHILGGQLYDTLGDHVGGFGVEASLSRNSVASDGVETMRSPNGDFYDIFVSQGKSGIRYDLILRLNASDIHQQVSDYAFRIIRSAATVMGIAILGVFLILRFSIVSPMRRIRNSVIAAIGNPDSAADHMLKFSRRDEIGETANAIDQILLDTSKVYQNDLSIAHDVIEQAKSAIIQYDPSGNLIAANPAALLFFCADNLEDLGRRDQQFLVLPERHKTRRHTLVNTMVRQLQNDDGGSYIEDGFVLVNGLEVPVLIIARPVRKQGGEIQRYFANLVDITKFQTQKQKLRLENDILNRRQLAFAKRNEELKKLMESCLILIGSVNVRQTLEAERKPVMPDRIIVPWYRDAQKNGLMHSAQLEHGILPIIMGHPERQKAIFRQALTLVYMRSKYETPQLTIYTSPKPDSMSEFIICDASDQAELPLKSRANTQATDWKLCYAALSQLMAQEGGELCGFADEKYENAIVFNLATAPENSHIDLQESNFAA